MSFMNESLRSVCLEDTDTVTSKITRSESVLPAINVGDEEENTDTFPFEGKKPPPPRTLTRQSKKSLSPAFTESVKWKAQKCRILMHGQIIALLTAIVPWAQASMHSHCGISVPAFGAMFTYLIRCFHLFPLTFKGDSSAKSQPRCYKFCGVIPLANPLWLHFVTAILSVESFYFTMLALRYTSVSAVTLFDSFAVPTVMIASRCIFSRRYLRLHVLGAIVCLVGVSLNSVREYQAENEETILLSPPTFRHIQQLGQMALVTVQRKTTEEFDMNLNNIQNGMNDYPQKILGDVLALFAGALGGMLDVATEHIIRTSGNVNEYLGVGGVLGLLISGIQVATLESQAVETYLGTINCSTEMGVSLLVGSFVIYYLQTEATARFLRVSEVALLHLSVLTSDVYRVLFVILAEHELPLLLFWLSFTLIVLGIGIYGLDRPPALTLEVPKQVDSFPRDMHIAPDPKRLE